MARTIAQMDLSELCDELYGEEDSFGAQKALEDFLGETGWRRDDVLMAIRHRVGEKRTEEKKAAVVEAAEHKRRMEDPAYAQAWEFRESLNKVGAEVLKLAWPQIVEGWFAEDKFQEAIRHADKLP